MSLYNEFGYSENHLSQLHSEEAYLIAKVNKLTESIQMWKEKIKECKNTDELNIYLSYLDNCNIRLGEVVRKLERLDSSLSTPFD